MTIYAAILAGGTGTRMENAPIPKQFLPLGNMPMLIYTLQRFISNKRIDLVYAAVPWEYEGYAEDMIKAHIKPSCEVRIVPGGADRNATLFNVIDAIENTYGINESDIVVTHDAVRPFVSERIINDNIDAAALYGACGTAISVTDTVFVSRDSRFIDSIPLRAGMLNAQTPQSFNIKQLKYLYGILTGEQKKALTDSCGIFTASGRKVRVVAGDKMNFKITTRLDYDFANAIVDKFDDL